MGKAEKVGRLAISAANTVVNTIVLVVILLLVCFGSYALWDSDQVHRAAAATNYAIYKPVPEAQSFEELIKINDDVFAWIEVYGTHIDYPVVQGKDNMKYINTNAAGKYSLSGAIFLDYHCARDFSDFSSILYGHHMEKNAMFGEIGDFSQKSYFDARRYGMLFFSGKEHGLEFFAFLHEDAYDKMIFRTNITAPEQQQAYLDALYTLAIHYRDIGVTIDDNIVLLTTCSSSSTNGRDILIARISDELFDNPFATEEGLAEELTPGGLLDWWLALPLCQKLLFIILPLLALLLLISFLVRRKRKAKARAEAARANAEAAKQAETEAAAQAETATAPVETATAQVETAATQIETAHITSSDSADILPHEEDAPMVKLSFESVDDRTEGE